MPATRREVSAVRPRLLADLLANSRTAAAYVAGPELIIEFANDECRRIAGDRALIGRPVQEALPTLAARGRLQIIERVAKTGTGFQHRRSEVWISQPGQDAKRLFMDVSYQPVRDDSGDVTGVLISAADVTAQVRDEQRLEAVTAELKAIQEHYRTLFETLPQGLVIVDAAGLVIEANPAARSILGLDEMTGRRWPVGAGQAIGEDGTPCRAADLPAMRALHTGEPVADMVIGVPHLDTGEVRWLRVTAVPDARDSRGRPRRAYVIFSDITAQRRAEATVREGSGLLGRLRDANVLGVTSSTEEGVDEANDAFLEIIGYDREDLAVGRISYRSITAAAWAGRDEEAMAELRSTGAVQPYDKEYVRRDGRPVPVTVGAAVVQWRPLRWVTFVVDMTARQRAEQERAALQAQERAARDEAAHALEQLGFLLRAGDVVAATRDRHELLDRAAQLVVPGLADYCVVFLPTGSGRLVATALAHRDPGRAAVLADLKKHEIPTVGPMTLQAAYNSGTSQIVRRVTTKLPHWTSLAPDLFDVLARLEGDTILATPLMAEEDPLGILLLARLVGRACFADTDVKVAEEFARRIADGMINADRFAQAHSIAETLQHAVLPAAVPRIGGLDIAVNYLPATDGVHVGGDWYDAFALDGDRAGLVIGDVAGHSIDSASIMGQVRSVLRAYAIDDPAPAAVLRRTNAALSRLLPEAVATVFYGVLDPATGDLACANAGHPPPLLVTPAHGAAYLECEPGIMLGALADADFGTVHHRLRLGSTLLCYTDGLIENRHRDISAGMRALRTAMRRFQARSAEQTCALALDSLLGTGARGDDVCLLSVRLPG